MKIENIEMCYMGKKCTIEDYVTFGNIPQNCPITEKVGALVYLKKGVLSIDLPDDDEFGIDSVMECLQSNISLINFYLLAIIDKFKITDVPDYVINIITGADIDERYDLFYKFLKTIDFD